MQKIDLWQRVSGQVYLDLYSPNILKNLLNLVLQVFLYLEAFEYHTTSDWLEKRQRMFLRILGEFGPWNFCTYNSPLFHGAWLT